MAARKYETFSTTADVGIRIRGKGYSEFYRNALNGLNLLYFGELPEALNGVSFPKPYTFEFHGDSGENILVNFLSEVVFLLQNKELVTTGLTIRKADNTCIDVDLLTIPLVGEPELEIKSVTYHNLVIKDNLGMKSAEIVFDI